MRQYEDLLIDVLLDRGFSVEEAVSLIRLQERVDRERREQRKLLLDDGSAHFGHRGFRDLYN